MPRDLLRTKSNLSNLGQMIGLASLNRNLKNEDCESAAYAQNMNAKITGEKSGCQPADDDMLVAGDVNVTNQQAAVVLPGWMKAALATLAALLLALLLLSLIVFLLWLWLTWPPSQPDPGPIELPQIRFIQPQT